MDTLVAVEPDREPKVAADEFVDEGVGGVGGVGADQDRPPAGWLGQGQQRHRQHLHMVGCGPGIAGPQDHGQRLPVPSPRSSQQPSG